MKINITSSSKIFNDKIIEANSIDDAIKRLQTDKKLVLSIIDTKYSCLNNSDYIPHQFVINTYKHKEYDVEIEIYNTYRE